MKLPNIPTIMLPIKPNPDPLYTWPPYQPAIAPKITVTTIPSIIFEFKSEKS